MMLSHNEILRFQEGTRSPHPAPEAAIASAPSGGTDAGEQLIVLVDLTPQLPHRSRELRAIAINTYWASSGSVVARLRRALAEANRHLVHANTNAAPGAKCSGNITCGVLTEKELFLGQIGAAYAFVWHPGNTLEVFPQRTRLLMPIGGTLPPVIHIGYTVLEEHSTLLLATTPLAEAQARERWQEILSAPSPEELIEQIAQVMEQSSTSGSLAFMQMLPKPKVTPQAQALVQPQHRWRLFGKRDRATVPPKPESSQSIEGMIFQPVEDSALIEANAEIGASLDAPPWDEPETETEPAFESAEATAASSPANFAISAPDPSQPIPPFLHSRDAGETSLDEEEPRTQSVFGLQKLRFPKLRLTAVREWFQRVAINQRNKPYKERQTTAERARLKQALRALLPGKVEGVQRAKIRVAPEEKLTVMAGLSLGLLLVVLFITLSMYLQFGGPARAEELLDVARNVHEKASATHDAEYWSKLQELSTQILTLAPQNEEAAKLKEEAELAIDAQQNTAILNATPLLDLGTAPSPRRLLIAERWLYVLNSATDEIIGLQLDNDRLTPLSDAPTPILKSGQTFYGEQVEHLVDLAWVKPGGNYPDGAVFIYSDGGTIYIYEPVLGPTGITRQHIQGDLQKGMVTLMEVYGEKIHLVQRQENQIMTYESVNGIYDLPRMYFAPGSAPYLQEALDLGIDDRVYLLMGDGSIQTYFQGTEDQFKISNLPDTNLKPSVLTIESDPDTGLVYLGDPQLERIVVLDKRGHFRHQFRLAGEELRQLEALAVGEDPHILYLIAANRLYAAPLLPFVGQ